MNAKPCTNIKDWDITVQIDADYLRLIEEERVIAVE